MDKSRIQIIAFDLDGTITQCRCPITEASIAVLKALQKKYKLLILGAGTVRRITEQIDEFPVDYILGNYGMQFCHYNRDCKTFEILREEISVCDRESVKQRIEYLRRKYGYTEYTGKGIEFNDSGCVIFPILGTDASKEKRLSFDPERTKRREIYKDICAVFPEYSVYIGGSSSFDFVPFPHNKYYALDRFCREMGFSHENVVYCGDDYGYGGNDSSIYQSDFSFIGIDDYAKLDEYVAELL